MTNRSELNANNAKVIDEFRQKGGKVASRPGQQLVLLNTIGAKSGLHRTNPVSYIQRDDCIYVFATKGGSPVHPDWYFNLVANPVITIELPFGMYKVTAVTVNGPERDAIYAEQVKLRPHFADYERRTTRIIPVVALCLGTESGDTPPAHPALYSEKHAP
jgi:deazaflavin-dependent oxidoreductase (nitroreductase family)